MADSQKPHQKNFIKMMDFNDESIEWLMQTSQTVDRLVGNPIAETDAHNEKHQNSFLNLLETQFLAKPILNESVAFGVLRWDEEFQTLLRKLRAFGCFFSVRTSRSSKGIKAKIFHNAAEYPAMSHPFSVNKSVRLYCSAGIGTNASDTTSSCAAFMTMRKVSVYTTISASNTKEHQLATNNKIRKGIVNGSVKTEEQLWVSVSLPGVHNHCIKGTDPVKNRCRRGLDSEVKATILQLSSDKNVTINEIKTELKAIIDNEFASDGFKPSSDNRAFFPSDKVIYNNLRDSGLIKSRKRKSIDVETLNEEINVKLRNLQSVLTKSCSKADLKKVLLWLQKIEEFLGRSK